MAGHRLATWLYISPCLRRLEPTDTNRHRTLSGVHARADSGNRCDDEKIAFQSRAYRLQNFSRRPTASMFQVPDVWRTAARAVGRLTASVPAGRPIYHRQTCHTSCTATLESAIWWFRFVTSLLLQLHPHGRRWRLWCSGGSSRMTLMSKYEATSQLSNFCCILSSVASRKWP